MAAAPFRPRELTGAAAYALVGGLAVASFLLLVGNSALGVVLPLARRELNLGLGETEWVVNAYTLVFAVGLLPCGRLVERVGARRMMLLGMVLFGLGAVGAGAAPSFVALTAARAVQGAGAAAVTPASLALLAWAFAGRRRVVALAAWSGAATLAMAVGPIVGGGLASAFGWRSILYASAVAAGLAACVTVWLAPETGRDSSRRVDLPGTVFSGIALGALVYALTKGSAWGLESGRFLVVLGVSMLAFAVLVAVERRSPAPLLPRSLVCRRETVGVNSVGFALNAAMCSALFFLSLYLQEVGRFSTLRTGVLFLPLTVPALAVAPLAGRLVERFGSRAAMTVGLLLVASSVGALTSVTASVDLYLLLPALLAMGVGTTLAGAPMTAVALAGAAPERAGSAAALLGSSRAVGLAFGVGLMGVFAGGARTPLAFAAMLRPGFAATAVLAAGAAAVVLLTIDRRSAATAARAPAAAGYGPVSSPVVPIRRARAGRVGTGLTEASVPGAAARSAARGRG